MMVRRAAVSLTASIGWTNSVLNDSVLRGMKHWSDPTSRLTGGLQVSRELHLEPNCTAHTLPDGAGVAAAPLHRHRAPALRDRVRVAQSAVEGTPGVQTNAGLAASQIDMCAAVDDERNRKKQSRAE